LQRQWYFPIVLVLTLVFMGVVMSRNVNLWKLYSTDGNQIDVKVPGVKVDSHEGKPDRVEVGDQVTLTYYEQLHSETDSDNYELKDTLVVTIGRNQIPPFVEQELLGMHLYEEKSITLPARFAYGPYYPQLVGVLPRSILPQSIKPREGMTVSFQDQNGVDLEARVMEVRPDSVVMDMNHPLAGKEVDLLATVVAIDSD